MNLTDEQQKEIRETVEEILDVLEKRNLKMVQFFSTESSFGQSVHTGVAIVPVEGILSD